MKSTHAPAVTQHVKLKHPTSLVQQLRDQSSFFGLKHGVEVKFCDCEAADNLDNEEWVMVDLVPALALGAVGQSNISDPPRQQEVSTTRDSDSTGNIGRRGAAKRKSYEAVTKVEVLEVFDRCVSNGSLAPKEDAAGLTGVHASLISKWAVPKTRQEIYMRAGNDKQKHLRKKARKFTGVYTEMEDQLYEEFTARRARGRRCGPMWLSVRGRAILKEMLKKQKDAQQREAAASETAASAAASAAVSAQNDVTDVPANACYVCKSPTWGPEKLIANTCSTCGLSWHHICSQPQCARCNPAADLPPDKIPPALTVAVLAAESVEKSPPPRLMLTDEMVANFKGSKNWRSRFTKRFKLVKRRRTNNKSKSKEGRVEGILQWHTQYFKMLRGDNAVGNPKIHEKWGRFEPHLRLNVDQTPLGFISGLQDTYEVKGSTEVWISTPSGSSLEKRQCRLQMCFAADVHGNVQPRLALISRGKGLRITDVEKAAWDPRVDVYFQPNAWADREFCVEWAKRTYGPWAKKVQGEKVLLMDNLDGQLTQEYRDFLKKEADTLPWYYKPNCTDLLQPVDRHIAQQLKLLIAVEQEGWLEDDSNLDKWESGLLTASERRILLTWWCGEAYDNLWKKYDSKKPFEGTGSLLTIDLSLLKKVKPQNVPDYPEQLLKALQSVHAAAVVDDMSTDPTEELVVEKGESESDVEDDSGDEALDSDSEHALEDTEVGVEPQVCWTPEGMRRIFEVPTLDKKFAGLLKVARENLASEALDR
ncbi:hypothetical protein CYMTET_47087 [Cymbomonas tetramitiformis]|uniref:DDE-1 domain-containing protein n=1 Tax=Cymbomonas tetramitiformis TaxID=36881 RepID=A0AAE0EWB8_9CHLO|nr:hypothetical protein CYMTET_47087 [Cymbomonas tetramitiformis]